MGDKLLLKSKDRNVLIFSEITKDYDWFLKLLIENEKITDSLINALTSEQQNFIKYMVPVLLKEATSEWKESSRPPIDLGEDRSRWGNCSLCNKPNRYLHFIDNRKSGKTINVGSECVKEYAFNETDIIYRRKEARKIRRLSILNDKIPGVKNIVENWKDRLDKFEILIPTPLSKNYEQLGEKLQKIYDDFLSGKGSESTIYQIYKLIQQGEDEIKEFEDYVKKERDNEFIVTRNMVNWLKRQNNSKASKALEWVREEGKVSYRAAHRIAEKGFMETVKTKMNAYLNNIGVFIEGILPIEESYIIKIIPLEQCFMQMKHEDLVLHFGWIMFNEEVLTPLSVKNVLKHCKIVDEKSIDVLLKAIAGNLKSSPIKVKGYVYDYNEVVIHDLSKNLFLLLNLKEFVAKYKLLAFEQNATLISDLQSSKGKYVNIGEYIRLRERAGYINL
ncbi:hypothetical protein [Geobacillus sp. TFV-3]|uniref:hypothetical protein n=1 Tax=Geobacillus sp. TFV-3 TaxID=1897059 RepID=UPI001357AB47|nr:hypothetical protein [Geobacillus sp. TFV-3]KAF0993998.1 hypothetical protein BJQ97_00640 [Geobacillus sp. TFV-3]